MREPLRLSLTLRSSSLTIAEISELIGSEPTKARVKAEPVSARNPGGPKREANTWRLESSLETDWDVNAMVEELEPALVRVAASREQFDSAELWLMAHGRSMGAWLTLASEQLALIASAGLAVQLDIYCGDDCCSDTYTLGDQPTD